MHTTLTITEFSSMGALAYSPVPAFTANLAGHTRHSRAQPRSRALCISRDRTLGEIRRAVVQRRFDTVSVNSVDEMSHLTSASPFDVIVLCHSLFAEERQRCITVAARAWPMAKIIFVASEKELSQPGVDKIVVGLAGPEVLLNAMQQVLRPAVSFADQG